MKFKDEVERQLAAALESFADEHLGVAEEAYFPNSLITNNHTMTNWGHSLAEMGISIEELNIDDFKLEGVKLERWPAHSYIIVRHGKNAFVYDSDNGYYKYATTYRAHRTRDNKYVDLNKIPMKQMLGDADEVWVIPKDDPSVEKINKLREQRKKDRELIEKSGFDRKTPEQIAKTWHSDRYDKSGYYIDKEAYMNRLATLRGRKLKNINFEEIASLVIDRYNLLVSQGFKAMNQLATVSDLDRRAYKFKEASIKFISALTDAKRQIESIKGELLRYSGYIQRLENGEVIDNGWWTLEKAYENFSKTLTKLQEFYKPEQSERWSTPYGFELMKASQELVDLASPSATEGLQNRDQYLVDKDINNAFESDDWDCDLKALRINSKGNK